MAATSTPPPPAPPPMAHAPRSSFGAGRYNPAAAYFPPHSPASAHPHRPPSPPGASTSRQPRPPLGPLSPPDATTSAHPHHHRGPPSPPSATASQHHHSLRLHHHSPHGHSPHRHHAAWPASEKASISSQSTGTPPSPGPGPGLVPAPAAASYGPAVQSALRDSCHSDLSSFLRPSRAESPRPDLEKLQRPRGSRHSDRVRTAYHKPCHGDVDVEVHKEQRERQDSPLGSKALVILLYLSSLNCLVTVAVLIYTLLALVSSALLLPFRLSGSSSPYRQQLTSLLAPALKLQLSLIYSSHAALATSFSAPMLVLVGLLSPVVSLGVAGSAWVAAAFWFFNAILGDPDGSDSPDGHNDGRASVMEVCKWWERWLVRPIRP